MGEYKRMTANVRKGLETNQQDETLSGQMKEINSYILLIVQFVVSVAASFLFGFLAPYYFWGREDLGGRLLIGIVVAFVVGCADMYFVIRHMLVEEGVIQIKEKKTVNCTLKSGISSICDIGFLKIFFQKKKKKKKKKK